MKLLHTRFASKLTQTPYSLSACIISLLVFANNTTAQSLDEAINEQLALGPLPCAELLADVADNTDRLTGGLLDICSAAVPAGSAGDSSGGGSASPISAPTIMQSITNAAHGDKDKSNELISINKAWGIFFTAEAESLDRENSDFEQGYDSDRARFIFGTSYTASPTAVYSLALDINQHEGDYSSGGNFENDSKGLRFLSSFRPTKNTFLTVLGAYDSVSAKQERDTNFSYLFNGASIFSTSGAANADYDYDQYGLSIDTGYEYQTGQYTLTPTAGIHWNRNDFSTHSETGNSGLELTFYDSEEESLQSIIGINLSASYGTGFGTFNPQFGLNWHHEFKDDRRTAEVSFTGDTLAERFTYETEEKDSDFFNVSAGFVLVFKGGLQGFANIQTLVGHDYYDSTIASLGLRYEL